MSILIRGMEMPTKGYRLILVHADGTVQTTSGETTAIPVPPHGRLIDADKLKAEFPEPADWKNVNEALHHVTGIWAAIDCAETVIPTEED